MKKNPGGLAGIAVGDTAICTVGKEGLGLTYRGYDIHERLDPDVEASGEPQDKPDPGHLLCCVHSRILRPEFHSAIRQLRIRLVNGTTCFCPAGSLVRLEAA